MSNTISFELAQFLDSLSQVPISVFIVLFILISPFIIWLYLFILKIDSTLFEKVPPLETIDPISLSRLVGFESDAFNTAIFRMYLDGLIQFEKDMHEKNESVGSFHDVSRLVKMPNAVGRDSLEKTILKIMEEKKCDALDYQVESNPEIVLILNQIHQNLKEKKFLRQTKWVWMSRILSLMVSFSFIGIGLLKLYVVFLTNNKYIPKDISREESNIFFNVDSEGFLHFLGFRIQTEGNSYLPYILDFMQEIEADYTLSIGVMVIVILVFILIILFSLNSQTINLSSKGRRFIQKAKNQYIKLILNKSPDPKVDLTNFIAVNKIDSIPDSFPEFLDLKVKFNSKKIDWTGSTAD